MAQRSYTIGELARLSGIGVRRLRFYADKGLLPPAGRTEGNYRIFSEADLVRLGLIRALREAGIPLGDIQRLLSRRLSMTQLLELRLAEVEAQIRSQRQVAATIRAALRAADPTPEDLRRIWTMTTLSQAERHGAISAFFDRVADGTDIDPRWKRKMVANSAADLPDEPSAAQIDAWIELSALIADPAVVAAMRQAAQDRLGSMDAAVFLAVQDAILPRARDALARQVEPGSAEGFAIADTFLEGWARAHGVAADAAYLARMQRKYHQPDGQVRRYWTLVDILKGSPAGQAPLPEWSWIQQAVTRRLAAL